MLRKKERVLRDGIRGTECTGRDTKDGRSEGKKEEAAYL